MVRVKLSSMRHVKPKGHCVQFEVLAAVVIKNTVFWDITPCRLLSVNRRFGGIYHLHLQGRKNKLSKKPE
jgi:hypothetical protein